MLDASAAVELVLATETGQRVADRFTESQASPHAPHLLAVEVAHVLRRFAARGQISRAEGRDALNTLTGLHVYRWEHEPLLPRAWDLREKLTVYDSMYVALAEALDAPLLTTDARLARAGGHSARIELVTA